MGKKKKKNKTPRGVRRDKLVEDGAYDGRFMERKVTPKKYKKEKYKHKITEYGERD